MSCCAWRNGAGVAALVVALVLGGCGGPSGPTPAEQYTQAMATATTSEATVRDTFELKEAETAARTGLAALQAAVKLHPEEAKSLQPRMEKLERFGKEMAAALEIQATYHRLRSPEEVLKQLTVMKGHLYAAEGALASNAARVGPKTLEIPIEGAKLCKTGEERLVAKEEVMAEVAFSLVGDVYDPQSLLAWEGWGRALEALDCPALAGAKFQHAVMLDPTYSAAWFGWYRCLRDTGCAYEAYAKLEQAAVLAPEDKNLAEWVANWKAEHETLAKAVADCNDFAAAEKKGALTVEQYLAWGQALAVLRRFEAAVKCFEKANKLNPRRDQPWIERMVCLGKMHQYEQALAVFETRMGREPDNAEFEELTTELRGELTVANTHAELVEEKWLDCVRDPEEGSAWYEYANGLYFARRWAEGLRAIHRAQQLEPDEVSFRALELRLLEAIALPDWQARARAAGGTKKPPVAVEVTEAKPRSKEEIKAAVDALWEKLMDQREIAELDYDFTAMVKDVEAARGIIDQAVALQPENEDLLNEAAMWNLLSLQLALAQTAEAEMHRQHDPIDYGNWQEVAQARYEEATQVITALALEGRAAYIAQCSTVMGHCVDGNQALFMDGDYLKAQTEFAAAVKTDAECGMAQVGLGRALMAGGALALAAEHFEQAVALDPTLEHGWARWGEILQHFNLFAEAKMVLDRGHEAIEDSPEIGSALRVWYAEQAKGMKAQETVDGFAAEREKNEKDERAMAECAEALVVLGRLEDAAGVYEKLAALEPTRVQTWLNWADLLLMQKKYAAAAEKARKGVALDPENKAMAMALQVAEGSVTAAKEAPDRLAKAEAAVKDTKVDLAIWREWVRALQDNGRLAEALEQARKAVDLAHELAEETGELDLMILDLEEKIARPAWLERMKKELGE